MNIGPWSSIIDSRSPKFLVKGHELAQALVVPGYRFAIIEVRSQEIDENGVRYPGTRYRVRDAHTVSDADVKAGKRPGVVFDCQGFDEALAWCEQHQEVYS